MSRERSMSTNLIESIDAWWTEFTARASDLSDRLAKRQDWDLPGWMQEHLQNIDENLMWEFGPAVQGNGYRLVITPESRRHLRPLVRQILDRAPKVDGWEFYAYRLPEDFDMAEQMVEVRSGGSIAKTFFRATVNDLNAIDLLFLSRDYVSDEDAQALSDVFVASETLLGEEVLNRWIGAIEVAPWDHGPEEPQGIQNLKVEVDRLVNQVRSKLPACPYFRLPNDQKWCLLKREAMNADEYPGRSDLFVGTSMIPAMWINAHRNQSLDSVRFSRQGEVFCYIKMDGSQGLDEEKFTSKSEIEDAIDSALRKAEVGCYIGGGTGLRYSYVDLALTDADRGVQIVKRVLRDGNIANRTWILFFDTDLQAEWVGIWEDTPPPPVGDAEE
jgi:hypothetical protein